MTNLYTSHLHVQFSSLFIIYIGYLDLTTYDKIDSYLVEKSQYSSQALPKTDIPKLKHSVYMGNRNQDKMIPQVVNLIDETENTTVVKSDTDYRPNSELCTCAFCNPQSHNCVFYKCVLYRVVYISLGTLMFTKISFCNQ